MKRIFLGLIAASMLVACNQSNKTQTPATTTAPTTTTAPGALAPVTVANAANAAAMKFEKDSFNFGKIKQGDKVSYDFKFANTGKSPLIITDAVASCGCTKPEWPKEPIKPGDSGIIKVTFNSTGKSGLQDKLVTITANTPQPQNLVHLVGEVVAPK